ncbi:MAG: hypothetical protein WC058_16390 [Phycisphaeraceae bacterium]
MSDAQVRDLIGRYVRGDAAAKAAVLEKLSGNPSDVMDSQADVRRLTRLILGEARKAGPRPSPIPMDETSGLPASIQKELAKFSKPMVATFQTPGGEMRVIMSDVSRKNHIAGGSPLLVLLHSGFGTPGGKLNQQEWVFVQRRAGVFTCVGMNVLPRCMNDMGRPIWNDDKEYRAVSAVLDELSRCYDVNCDRVYLIGDGSGAWGAWHLGVIEGDRFAVVVDIAGTCPLKSADQFANFRNVDVGVFVGKEDNTVVVTSTDVPELTVYLSEQLADMEKPVKVIWNGKPAAEVQPVMRLSVMLRTLTEHYDEGMFYTFKAELKSG